MKQASWIVALALCYGPAWAEDNQVTFKGKQGSVWLQQQVTNVNIPNLSPDNRVCQSPNGEQARVLERIVAAGSSVFWLRVEVLTGTCKGAIGWVLSDTMETR